MFHPGSDLGSFLGELTWKERRGDSRLRVLSNKGSEGHGWNVDAVFGPLQSRVAHKKAATTSKRRTDEHLLEIDRMVINTSALNYKTS